MVTERSYKHALKVIKAYEEQQKNLKFEKLKELGITLDTCILDLTEHISVRLFSALYDKHFYSWWERNQKLSDFITVTEKEISKWYNVGKGTVEEFKNLMAIAGHTVL